MTIPEINNHFLLPIENKNYSDFNPICFGAERCAPVKSCSCLRDYYLIHFVLSGSGSFDDLSKKTKIEAGQAFLIRPGKLCKYSADKETPWLYTWIGFEGNLAKHFDTIENVFETDNDITNDLLRCLDMKIGAEEYLIGILFKLFGKLSGEKPCRDKTKQITDFIGANFMRDIKISDIAEMLGYNRKYLARSFKEKCGFTIHEYLIKKRLSEGKKLLEKEKSVEDCGLMVGYSDGFAFSKAFKREYGISPAEYKKLHIR